MDLAMRVKNEQEDEDIKIVLVKPGKLSLPSSVPSAEQLHQNGVRQGGLDLFSVSRKPTPERETSVPLPPSIPPTPPPTQPITPAGPAFDPTAFFNALTVWMQQQTQLQQLQQLQQQQQQLQQGQLLPAAAAPAAVSHTAARELHTEISLRIEEMAEVDEDERENGGRNEETLDIAETEEPSIDDELKKLLEGSSEEQKMQLLEFVRSGGGGDGKVEPKRKGLARAVKEKKNSSRGNHKNQKKSGVENRSGRGRDRKVDVGNENRKLKKGNEGKDFVYWIGRTEEECCPQCGEFVALTGRRIHYIRFHYNLFYPLTQQGICDVERWLGTRIGKGGEGNRPSNVDCRICMHCKESKQYKGRERLLRHIENRHPEDFEDLRRDYKQYAKNRHIEDHVVHRVLTTASST